MCSQGLICRMVQLGNISILLSSTLFQIYPPRQIHQFRSRHFFSTKEPQPIVLRPEDIPEDPNDIKETDSDVVKLIKELLSTRIRPRIKADGGDIFFQSFDDSHGIVKVKVFFLDKCNMQLTGACKGCASSSVTLKQGVEQMMKHYIPEVQSVESIEDSDTPEVKAAKEKAEKELRRDFEDELAAAIADEMKKMKKRKQCVSAFSVMISLMIDDSSISLRESDKESFCLLKCNSSALKGASIPSCGDIRDLVDATMYSEFGDPNVITKANLREYS